MSQRLDPAHVSPTLFKAYAAYAAAVTARGLEQTLRDLIHIRASQINNCAFCLDMHVKEATIHGERPLRLHHIAIWRESTLFTPRERAVLEWTEAVTKLGEHGVPDAVYDAARAELTEQELVDLTFDVVLINGWNRLMLTFQVTPGSLDEQYGLTKAGLS